MSCPVCLEGRPSFLCRALLHAGCPRDILRCPGCGASFYWPLPSPEEIARCYPPLYFDGFFRQYWKDYYKGRALAEGLGPSGAFLDVGCALGTLLAGLRDASGWSVAGLETSAHAARLGRELNSVDIEAAPVAQAPWPDASFDRVHMNNVLEHEADPAAALSRAARLLKPGGLLLLTLPNGPVDLEPTRALYERLGRPVPTKHGGHLFFLTRKAVAILLGRARLRPVSIDCFHFRMGLKALGRLPGAWKRLEAPPPPGAPAPALSLEEYRRLIPPKPSWPLYELRRRWRRLFRSPSSGLGYDLEVIASG
jgi:SAM-dependent methyltransferase